MTIIDLGKNARENLKNFIDESLERHGFDSLDAFITHVSKIHRWKKNSIIRRIYAWLQKKKTNKKSKDTPLRVNAKIFQYFLDGFGLSLQDYPYLPASLRKKSKITDPLVGLWHAYFYTPNTDNESDLRSKLRQEEWTIWKSTCGQLLVSSISTEEEQSFPQYYGRLSRFTGYIAIEQENTDGAPEKCFAILNDPMIVSKNHYVGGFLLAISFNKTLYSTLLIASREVVPDPASKLVSFAKEFKFLDTLWLYTDHKSKQ